MMLHEIAPKKYRVEYRNASPVDGDRIVLLKDKELLVREEEALRFPAFGELKEMLNDCRLTYLFAIDETAYFTVLDTERTGRLIEEIGAGFVRIPERSVRYRTPREEAYAAAVAVQLIGWYRRSMFCGKCGARTEHSERERMMHCPKCGNMIYPEIHPSVIIAIFHEGRLLVTRYNPKHREVSNGQVYQAPVHEALVAGYIETGETAEEAVKREALEEVGLKVKNIRFYRDTPWPFSGSLLFSFLCEVDGDPTIRMEEDELSMAVFKTREEMPDRSNEVSLTSAIMEDFRLGKL